MRSFLSLVGSLVSIVFCGALGAGAGYLVRGWLDADGVSGALLAAVVAMVVASAAWIAGSTLLRTLRVIR